MKSEEIIQQEIESLKKQIQKNLVEHNKELERGFPMSANVHWEYHIMLKAWRDCLNWVLKEDKKDKEGND